MCIYRLCVCERESRLFSSKLGSRSVLLLGCFPANQINMTQIRLGVHTIRSHGVEVLRFHMHDWIILGFLILLEVMLAVVIPPFHRFVGEDMMTDLKYPFHGNTIPFGAVPVIAILVPFFVMLGIYIIRRDVYDFHHALLGILYSVLITAVVTDAIKDAVGRPRPNFYWRCFPDGVPFYDNSTRGVICHGDKAVIKEGHKSFPSGHTSWSFAGLGFLSLYLAGKIQAFDQKGHVAKLCVVFLPLLVAALVGTSRVDDYWHHWQDVFAGGLIGMTFAVFCYLQLFPPPYHIQGWGPYAYFQNVSVETVPGEQELPNRSFLPPESNTGNDSALVEEIAGDNSYETSHMLDVEAGKRS